jgi:hypothetical protein
MEETRSSFWWEFAFLCILALLICVGLFLSLGKSVQSRVGAATQKMVGSITHDGQLQDYGADGRVPESPAHLASLRVVNLDEWRSKVALLVRRRQDGGLFRLDGAPKALENVSGYFDVFVISTDKIKEGEEIEKIAALDQRFQRVALSYSLSKATQWKLAHLDPCQYRLEPLNLQSAGDGRVQAEKARGNLLTHQ